MPTGGSGLQQLSSNKMELPSGRCFCLTQRDQIWWEPETWHCLQFPTSKHFFFQANFGSYIYPRLSGLFPVQQELSLLEVLWLPGLTGPPPLWAIYIKILQKLLRMAFSVFKNLDSIESQPRRCSPIFPFSCHIRRGYMIMCLKQHFWCKHFMSLRIVWMLDSPPLQPPKWRLKPLSQFIDLPSVAALEAWHSMW